MKHILALLCGMLLTTALSGATLRGNVIRMDEDELQACEDGGGCVLVTQKRLEQLRTADCSNKI